MFIKNWEKKGKLLKRGKKKCILEWNLVVKVLLKFGFY